MTPEPRTDLPVDWEIGQTEWSVRRAIRDLILVYSLRARDHDAAYAEAQAHVATILLDMGGARTIEHERH
jgi:hypothetical protein